MIAWGLHPIVYVSGSFGHISEQALMEHQVIREERRFLHPWLIKVLVFIS